MSAVEPLAEVVVSNAPLPRVVVLLATYNGARWLPDLLDSLAAQQGVVVDVLAADDGSRDETRAVLAAGRPGLSIRMLDGPRAGTPARNFARLLTEANLGPYDFVAFCDQDDLWLPHKLRQAIAVMDARGASCYGSDLIAFHEDGTQARVHKGTPQRRFDHLFQSASAACTYVLRSDAARDLAARIGASYRGWSDLVSFDCLVYAVTRSHGWRWTIDADAGILYRQHAGNVEGANVGVAALLRRLRIARRGWIRNNVRAFLPYVRRDRAIDAVVDRIERGSVRDRLWLAGHAGEFRREPLGRAALRLCFLFGWL